MSEEVTQTREEVEQEKAREPIVQMPDEYAFAVTFAVTAPDGGRETYLIRGEKMAELPQKAKVAKEALAKMGYKIEEPKPVVPAVANVASAGPVSQSTGKPKQYFKAHEVEWQDEDTPLCPLHHTPMRLAPFKPRFGGDRLWQCSEKRDPVKPEKGPYCNRAVTK